MIIEIDHDEATITLEGVKFTTHVLENILNFPPQNVLLSAKRVGDRMEITTYRDTATAQNFFDNLPKASRPSGHGP